MGLRFPSINGHEKTVLTDCKKKGGTPTVGPAAWPSQGRHELVEASGTRAGIWLLPLATDMWPECLPPQQSLLGKVEGRLCPP
jgi:hypothetical protein